MFYTTDECSCVTKCSPCDTCRDWTPVFVTPCPRCGATGDGRRPYVEPGDVEGLTQIVFVVLDSSVHCDPGPWRVFDRIEDAVRGMADESHPVGVYSVPFDQWVG